MPNPTLLLVEDNATQQYVLRELCKRFEYELQVVGSGEEALETLSCNSYAAVLMDVRLPGIDGWECARTIRTMEKGTGKRVPIIGITAYAYDDDKQKCLQSGMDDYLAKPFAAEALRAMLLRWTYSPERPNLKLLKSNSGESNPAEDPA